MSEVNISKSSKHTYGKLFTGTLNYHIPLQRHCQKRAENPNLEIGEVIQYTEVMT